MRTTNTVYVSDLLSMPMPRRAASHQEYLKKIRNRRILWALLPYLVRGLVIAVSLMLTMSGLTVMVLGMGG